MPSRKVSPEDCVRIRALAEGSWSAGDLARHYDIGLRTVKMILAETYPMGVKAMPDEEPPPTPPVPPPPPVLRKSWTADEINKRMLKNGMGVIPDGSGGPMIGVTVNPCNPHQADFVFTTSFREPNADANPRRTAANPWPASGSDFNLFSGKPQ